MKNKNLLKNVNKAAHKLGFELKKRSPEILIVVGTIGTISSCVMACKATTKIDSILEKTKKDIDKVHLAEEKKDFNGEIYTKEDSRKDLTIIYTKAGVEFIKLYAPAVITGTLSLAGIITSHNILRKRYIAATAAYATINKSFKEYRKRVVERFGNDVDRELRYNIKSKTFDTIETDENGNEKTVTKTCEVMDNNLQSDFSRYFDNTALGWEDNLEHNMFILRGYQTYANAKLEANGYLFLNDVYDELGFQRTKAGQIVGWLYKPDDPKWDGDNYVDFGIREVKREVANGVYEDAIILDFNVDGNILDLI